MLVEFGMQDYSLLPLVVSFGYHALKLGSYWCVLFFYFFIFGGTRSSEQLEVLLVFPPLRCIVMVCAGVQLPLYNLYFGS